MANLKFKTRGQTDPKGKRRVYFSCHKEDFSPFFERITDEILEISNCAIYYYDPNDEVALDEDYYLDLSQMNLFVTPVTTKYLTGRSRAYDVEFRYAMEHHIPVLPLMQESGLAELFGEKCGDLQYLDPNASDATAISYEEKLKKYINSVLIGDELADKVRGAFDAYIFLSYRKKDRKHAQELMRLIHQNEFCRDIAIWYDEFLTPGESFNNAIEEALKKSALFALAVTPNLVNEKNYVMRVEYPMAVEHGKKVLPAEMVETDGEALRENYAGIPDPTDAHDEGALSQALINALEEVAKKENDNDPQHNFFIGLAYLYGIDVETDHQRAINLITLAAECGLMEAMKKLADMYHNGEAVERDYIAEIAWLERMAEQAKKNFESNKTEYNANLYFSKLWDLGDAWYAIRQLKKAKEVYEKMLEAATLFDAENITPRAKRDLSVSYNKLGEIYQSQGNLETAKGYYEKCLEIFEQLAKETGTVQSRRDLSISYERLGDIYESQGDLETAKGYYEKSLEIFEQLAKETGTVQSRRDLSISYERLGDIYRSQGDLETAKGYYEKDLEISEQLAKETDTVEARRAPSVSYNKLGYIYQSQGNLETAKGYYEKSLEIREQLAKISGTPESYDDLAVSYYSIAMLDGDIAKLQKAYDIYEMLCRKCPGVSRYVQIRDVVKRQIQKSRSNSGGFAKTSGTAEKSTSPSADETKRRLAELAKNRNKKN